jgi:heptosyltransferase-3
MNNLYARGNDLVLFGAPRECGRLQADFADEIKDMKIAVVAGDIAGFRANLSQVDLLIGMDSFSVHLAYALSLRTVVLYGPSDRRILAPPGSLGISAGHLCDDYPCNYKYPCRNQTREYICCRGIEVDAVIDAVEQLKRDAPRERRSQ